MKRSGMPSPTSCDLSPDTNVYKDNNVNEDTEPRHAICTLLAPCAILSCPALNSRSLSGLSNFSTVNVLLFFRHSLMS